MDAISRRKVRKTQSGVWSELEDDLVTEAPLEIRMGGTPLAVLMRTPGDDEDLIRGFVLTEGIVLSPNEVGSVAPAPQAPDDNRWELSPADGVEIDPAQFQRNMYTTSSCGVCGKASIDAVRVAALKPPSGPQVAVELLLALPQQLRDVQKAFEATGGLHGAALFDDQGKLLAVREDVGRHNAVDKVIGALSQQAWPLGELILMVSGRISFEIAQKAAVAGVPIVCGVSAASSLAAELGEELGLTVVGFLRDDGFNLYTDAGRVGTV